MRPTSLAIAVVVVLAATGVAQTPLPPLLSPPPVENIAPPPPAVIADPLPQVVEVVEVVSPVETLVAPRFVVSADIGPIFAGWGALRSGTLTPPQPFGRSQLFPIPVAEYDSSVSTDTAVAARVSASYTFERMPLTVTGSWETYQLNAETRLLGFDPLVAPHLDSINSFNQQKRQGTTTYTGQDAYLREYADTTAGNSSSGSGNQWQYPRVQMRSIPSDPLWLQSRVTANVADINLAYQLWTPRWEWSSVLIHLQAGARYGGFFADDRAVGDAYKQSASNWFNGFGPQGGLRIEYRLWPRFANRAGSLGFWLDTRGGALFGQATQRFREFDPANGGDEPFRELVQRADRTVPFLASEFGVTARGNWWQGSIAIRYSQYWGIGNIGASRMDFSALALVFGIGLGF